MLNKHDINEFVLYACKILEIKPLPVMYKSKLSKEFKNNPNTGALLHVQNDKAKSIILNSDKAKDGVAIIFYIAHELRHAYQVENKLFDVENYKERSKTSFISYNNQEAEIDANAFAYAILYREGIKITLPFDEQTNEKILSTAEDLLQKIPQ